MGPLAGYRLRNPGRSLAPMLVYEAVWTFAWTVATLVYRLRVRGRHHIPAEGPLLVVSNHQSHLDPPCVTVAFAPRHINFIARGGLFRNRLFGGFIACLNSVPIKENGSDTAAIRTALDQLAKGRVVLIFPEGSRSFDGELQTFKRGVWLLMSKARCPILPVAIDGAFDAWPRRRPIPSIWGRRVRVDIGPPIPHRTLAGLDADAGLQLIRERIATLRDGLRRQHQKLP